MSEPATTSVAALMNDRMVERVKSYRGFVARVAAGAGLPREDAAELSRTMRALGLPDYAFRRDVRAWAGGGTARGYRLAELAVLHPHLFDKPEAWVRDRAAAAGRGRG